MVVVHIPMDHTCSLMCTNHRDMTEHTQDFLTELGTTCIYAKHILRFKPTIFTFRIPSTIHMATTFRLTVLLFTITTHILDTTGTTCIFKIYMRLHPDDFLDINAPEGHYDIDDIFLYLQHDGPSTIASPMDEMLTCTNHDLSISNELITIPIPNALTTQNTLYRC